MKIVAVIVTYNALRNDWLNKCLQSVFSSNCAVDCVVIDNNSSDNTVAIVKENYPQVTLVESNENLGFGKANNKGFEIAIERQADYIFLLNQDAWVQVNTLKSLTNIAKENSAFGILSPIHLNGKGDKLDKNFSNYMRYDCNEQFYADAVFNKFSGIYAVPFVNAAAWLIPMATLKVVGGFDPLFYHYGEDRNYCQRIQYHGFKIGVVPNTYINHDRESRKPVAETDDRTKLERIERSLKVHWANINKSDVENEFKTRRRNKIKQYLLSIARFSFKEASFIRKELKIIDKIVPAVIASREANKNKNAPHL